MDKGKNTEYYNKFYRKWFYHYEYIDIETGELLERNDYKKNYKTIEKTINKSYKNEYGHQYIRHVGRKKERAIQLNLF